MMIRYLLISRQFILHPWQFFLSIIGIALGVSVVLAIDLTNASAERAFKMGDQIIGGEFTHQIIGGSSHIDETLYKDLRMEEGLRELIPVVEGQVVTDGGFKYKLVGIDPVVWLGKPYRSQTAHFSESPFALLNKPGAVYISRFAKEQLKLNVPADIEISVNDKTHKLTAIDVLPERTELQDYVMQAVFITDISTAQTLLDMHGKLSRIDLKLDEIQLERLEQLLSEPLQLIRSGARGKAMEQMTRAFRINLTALSLLALVVGAFLIYNTMTISVLQRRELIATVRTLGLARNELSLLILGETLILAVIGIILGIGLGIGLSHYLIKLASRTLSDLYFVEEVRTVYFNHWSFYKAVLLGFGVSLLAAWLPVHEAVRIAPEIARSRSRLEAQARIRQKTQLLGAMLSLIIAVVILWQSERSVIAGFASLFFIIMAYALLSPTLLIFTIRTFKPVMTRLFGLSGSIASRSVLSSLSRTQIAVTALAIAISATVGVSIMIGGFRHSVEIWLENYLQADIYISPMNRTGGNTEIDEKLIHQLKAIPGVLKLTTAKWKRLWDEDRIIRLYVADLDEQIFNSYRFKGKHAQDQWHKFLSSDSVVVSESYAYHQDIETGDSVYLLTDRGKQSFEVAGIYTDYLSDQGVITMHRNIYESYWGDKAILSLSLYAHESIDPDVLVTQINNTLLADTVFRARANRTLRNLSMKIFDRTFAITEVLRFLTIIIAFIGILGALIAIQLERNREFAILRANGMTPDDIKKLILSESGLMGTTAGLIAMPLGVILSVVLIHVINRRSFGWSMDFVMEPVSLISAVLLGLTAGLLAGIYPAWRTSTTIPAIALRDE